MAVWRPSRRALLIGLTGVVGLISPRHRATHIVAHRGCRARYPENTAFAARRVARWVDAVEIDVRRCGSGQLVAFHDATVDRVTTASGRVDRLSLAELRTLRVEKSDHTVDTFRGVVRAVPQDTALLADLKEPGLAADVAAVLDAAPNVAGVAARSPTVLDRYREVDPDRDRLLIAGDHANPVATSRRLGCRTVLFSLSELASGRAMTAATIANGLSIGAWPIGSTAEAWTARRLGARTLVVDRPTVVA